MIILRLWVDESVTDIVLVPMDEIWPILSKTVVDTLKKTRFLLAWTMSKLVDIYKRQVTDKLTTSSVPISEGQSSNLDSTDPVK